MPYTPIIGLEIHVELATKQKMFCGCSAPHFQVAANTHTCPVCLGLPGALPVPNHQAIEWCQLIGLALNCTLATQSKFDRKNYFYPDLPKGYQISQYDQPLCQNGEVTLSSGKKIGITRVHLEEDTGKNQHMQLDGTPATLVDFNRSGVPLVEIVTEPDFRSAEEADEFLKTMRQTLRYLEVSDCDMEKGSMRLEVNMSLMQVPSAQYLVPHHAKQGTKYKVQSIKLPSYKVEVKNINSFRFAKKAIEFETNRQAAILDQGKTPMQETRGYQEDVDKSISQRSKEEAADYRYFPEPDIPPLHFNTSQLQQIEEQLPELPQAKLKRFLADYGLTEPVARFLTETKKIAQYFEQAVEIRPPSMEISSIANSIKNNKLPWQVLSPQALIDKIAEEKASLISDTSVIESIVSDVMTQHPQVVEQYKAGKVQVIGFLIGQTMQQLKGKGDAKRIQDILRQLLE